MKEKLDRKKEEVKILTEEERNRQRYLEMDWYIREQFITSRL
jgi:hypothetical protein